MKFALTVSLALGLALAALAAPAQAGLTTDRMGVQGCTVAAPQAATACKPDALAVR